jgi:hypothetical protein
MGLYYTSPSTSGPTPSAMKPPHEPSFRPGREHQRRGCEKGSRLSLPSVFGIADQFMYGPALLINPITSTGTTSRSVYLPAGSWYNFWTGATATGGTKVTVDAPLSQIPIFVKAGSIVPMGPKIQYAMESVDPLEIRVYKGANGSKVDTTQALASMP